MRKRKSSKNSFISDSPLRNLPATIQATKEEAEELRSKEQTKEITKVRLFKDKEGLYKF